MNSIICKAPPLLSSKHHVHVPSPAVELDYIFSWRILWLFANSSKPITNVCFSVIGFKFCNNCETVENFLSWEIVGFHIMWFFQFQLPSTLESWMNCSSDNRWVQLCSIQIVLWIWYTSIICNDTNQSSNWLTNCEYIFLSQSDWQTLSFWNIFTYVELFFLCFWKYFLLKCEMYLILNIWKNNEIFMKPSYSF